MKKIPLHRLNQIQGGGCGKWVRRYERAFRRGADDGTLRALEDALSTCIFEKYYT